MTTPTTAEEFIQQELDAYRNFCAANPDCILTTPDLRSRELLCLFDVWASKVLHAGFMPTADILAEIKAQHERNKPC